jgi:hypothetical protein
VSKTQITIEFDGDELTSYTDERLALLWHVAQANPAPHGDHAAGELVERIGREIITRWLRGVQPELWHHQGSDYYWAELRKFARYEPGGKAGSPEFHAGRWVPRADGEAVDRGTQ